MYQGSHVTPNAQSHITTETPPAWTVPWWHVGSMDLDSWGCLLSHTHHLPDTIGTVTCQTGNFFLVIYRCWWSQARGKALFHAVNNDTWLGLQRQKPISMTVCWIVPILTIFDTTELKFAAIWRSFACLSRLKILASCWRSDFFKVFFWLYLCQIFDVLPEIWYSWHAPEIADTKIQIVTIAWN